ncbi:MAG TPA: HesA/MoeB/ThiF family protein [Candidatus Binataceae bacterium]|nr:HesA/MoeB/ThiF family protein [Candidatus Binataceae bacterium]
MRERSNVFNNRILIVGAGGLGIPAASALAKTGGLRLTLIDADPVELSNLARQVIFRTDDIGVAKVEAAARRLRGHFPTLEIEPIIAALDSGNAHRLISAHDVVIDATDDPAVKFLINDVCLAADRPFVYGGVLAMSGQALTVIPQRTACLRCLFEEPPADADIASCREAGIVGPVAGVIGEIQASEALAILREPVTRLSGRILTYDAAATPPRVRIAEVAARRGCACGAALAHPSVAARN